MSKDGKDKEGEMGEGREGITKAMTTNKEVGAYILVLKEKQLGRMKLKRDEV